MKINTTLINVNILAFWLVLVAGIYIFGFWTGPPCRPSSLGNENESDYQHTDVESENSPWYIKYPDLYPKRNLSTLVLLHVIARHGDRTNLKECQYPQDPYLNETYAPYGYGGLTNLGKRRMFEVGRALRQDYYQFLHEYQADDLDAVSSDLNRAKASLELILAGLYPPSEEFVWMKGFNWQPVPFRSTMGKDNLLGNPRHNCANWNKYFEDSMENFQDVMTNYSDYFNRLVNFTGWKRNLLTISLFYNSITTNLDWGYELDDKLKDFWPEPTSTLNNIFWKAWSETEDTRRASAGLLLQTILEDTEGKITQFSKKKLHIYSCHDFNIISLLRIFGQEIYDNPPFGAHIIIELHKDKTADYYLKFFYRAKLDEPMIEINISDCRSSGNDIMGFSFEDFRRSRIKYFPAADFC